MPRTLIDIVALSGVGPKKAARLWKELGIETVEELAAAAKAGGVAELDGFGEASQDEDAACHRAAQSPRPGATSWRMPSG